MELNLPINVLNILNILNKAGYDAYVVGGAVRSLLLGEKPKDYDICTNALPDSVENLFESTIPTGKKYGTITVVMPSADKNEDEFYEITTFRYDSPITDGRRPEYVIFGQTLKDDIDRRDFTINSIAYNPLTGIIDYKNGLEDIKNKVIRCVGNPTARFREDGLRVLRAIRFAVRYKFLIDTDTLNAMVRLTIKNQSINVLDNISKERIHDEIVKILSYDFSFLPDEDFIKIKSILEDILKVNDSTSFTKEDLNGYLYIRKLISLYKDCNIYILESKLKDLKFNNDEIKIILNSVKAYQYLKLSDLSNDDLQFRIKMCSYRWEPMPTLYAKNMLDLNKEQQEIIIKSLVEPYTLKELDIDGNDIKANFNIDEKMIKTYLEMALFYIFKNPKENKKDILLNYLGGLNEIYKKDR